VKHFAETKNAALLTFASAGILAMLNLLSSDRTLPPGFASAFLAAAVRAGRVRVRIAR
jgi:hypothetical protein